MLISQGIDMQPRCVAVAEEAMRSVPFNYPGCIGWLIYRK